MGGRELSIKKSEGLNQSEKLSEKAARTLLRVVHRQKHVYVELRQVGKRKRTIFFCTLCQTPCFNDSVLDDHLRGKLHSRRLTAAKITLFGPTPWPFSDGVFFFDTSCANDNGCKSCSTAVQGLSIPDIVHREEAKNVKSHFIGYGCIGIRYHEMEEGQRSISRIWCAWLGLGDSDDCKSLPKFEYEVVSYTYMHTLGKRVTLDEFDAPLSPVSFSEFDELGEPVKRLRKSVSVPEDSAESSADASDQLDTSKLKSSKSGRRKLKKQKCQNAERTCNICKKPMLLGKDVSTLFNWKTGKIACSSGNPTGALHLFHTSCLIHWILLFKSETWTRKSINVKTTMQGRRDRYSIVCPQRQGTGIHIEGDGREKLSFECSEMDLLKSNKIEAHKAWMKTPEVLKKYSTGLQFPSDSSVNLQIQENVKPLKLVHFYCAYE